MANQITSPRPQGNTQTTASHRKNAFATGATLPAQNEQPTYVPTQWELQHGFTRDGVFYRPPFGIYCNGEPLDVDGDFNMTYPYEMASHILTHLKAVSNNDFSIEPIAWKPMFNHCLDRGRA